jgi:hypothetical protein
MPCPSSPDLELDPRSALLHPLFVSGLALLILNDHVLKGAGILPAVLTGKLSDVAGMWVAPTLVALALRVRTRAGFAVSHALVGAGFAAIKLIPAAAGALAAGLTQLGIPSKIWVDPTDLLVAIPALAIGFHVLSKRQPRRVPRRTHHALALAAAIASMATSRRVDPIPPSTPVDAPLTSVGPDEQRSPLAGTTWITVDTSTALEMTFNEGTYVVRDAAGEVESGKYMVAQLDATAQRLVLHQRKGARGPLPERSLALEQDGFSFESRAFRRKTTTAPIAGE